MQHLKSQSKSSEFCINLFLNQQSTQLLQQSGNDFKIAQFQGHKNINKSQIVKCFTTSSNNTQNHFKFSINS
ncbi:CLUMA_CG008044, isoform A [Clunio marinus]|uniref:CLUMA_CG008044, isoform A n=1 Tax=Clunio marinus TaxID=568069 RepID=A0A1J1I2N5_9DIPT|nr:CLUMA_CG008044, isoform A [Clunio marinus]